MSFFLFNANFYSMMSTIARHHNHHNLPYPPQDDVIGMYNLILLDYMTTNHHPPLACKHDAGLILFVLFALGTAATSQPGPPTTTISMRQHAIITPPILAMADDEWGSRRIIGMLFISSNMIFFTSRQPSDDKGLPLLMPYTPTLMRRTRRTTPREKVQGSS